MAFEGADQCPDVVEHWNAERRLHPKNMREATVLVVARSSEVSGR